MRKVLLASLILLCGVAAGYIYYKNFVKPKVVHYHAGFHVYVDGKLQDFSDIKYMNIEPCSTHSKNEADAEDEQMERAHLHDLVGDVVHVHRNNVVWGDLFQNIKFRIDTSKPILGLINGRGVDDVLHYPIHSYDSLVLIIGKHGDAASYLKEAVKKEHIVKMEKKSETCGS